MTADLQWNTLISPLVSPCTHWVDIIILKLLWLNYIIFLSLAFDILGTFVAYCTSSGTISSKFISFFCKKYNFCVTPDLFCFCIQICIYFICIFV